MAPSILLQWAFFLPLKIFGKNLSDIYVIGVELLVVTRTLSVIKTLFLIFNS